MRIVEALLVAGLLACSFMVSPWLTGALVCFGGLMMVDRFDR